MSQKLKNIPSGWEVKCCSDVLFFQEGPGVRKWQFKEEGVKLLNGGNINNNRINLSTTKHYLSEDESYSKYKHFLIDEGDLLIACSGITINTFYKKIAFIKNEDLPLCLNTSTMRFKSLGNIELRYFYYYLQTNNFTKQIQKLITGSAQLNFGPSHIKKIKIPLPPLNQQKKIASILDTADAYRQKTKALLTKYEELTQSLFLDMFGDPVMNPKGWEVKIIDKVCQKIYGGGTPSKAHLEYFEGLIPWVTPKDMKFEYISNSRDHINQLGVDNSSAKLIPKNSVLMVIRSGILKHTLPVAINTEVVTVNQDMKAFIPNLSLTNSVYLKSFFQAVSKYLLSKVRAVTADNIEFKQIKELKFICPPLNLQNEFAERVQAIEEQKTKAQASLAQAEDLFNSLLQKAFKGELVN